MTKHTQSTLHDGERSGGRDEGDRDEERANDGRGESRAEEERQEERVNARRAFDSLDRYRIGWVEESQLKKLMASTSVIYSGEDHGPKLISICEEGRLFRRHFLSWYDAWLFKMDESWTGEGQTGNFDAPATQARNVAGFAARREERANAAMSFDRLDHDGYGWVQESQFKELMLAASGTYSVEAHRPALLSISEEGWLQREAFLSWHDTWLFGENDAPRDSSDEEEEFQTIEEKEDETADEEDAPAGHAWGVAGSGGFGTPTGIMRTVAPEDSVLDSPKPEAATCGEAWDVAAASPDTSGGAFSEGLKGLCA